MANYYQMLKAFPYIQGEFRNEHFERFIRTEIIEKLIEELPWWDERGEDVARSMVELKQQLRAKWLGKDDHAN